VVRSSGTGVRTSIDRCRLPDVVVFTQQQCQEIRGKSAVLTSAPLLVVEVVSSGEEQIDRDYRQKRAEYEALGISEYWIVKLFSESISIVKLVKGKYRETVFEKEDSIASQIFSQIDLTVRDIFNV